MKERFAIIFMIAIIAGCARNEDQTTTKAPVKFCIPDSLMNQIKTDTVSIRPVIEEIRLAGKVTFDQDKVVKLYPMVSGNVLTVNVALGDHVEKGEVLAVVNSALLLSTSIAADLILPWFRLKKGRSICMPIKL